jgi:hypothetical protein
LNGLPVYAHPKDDLKSFRYITSNFIHQGLCRKTEIERCFHVSEDIVQRAYIRFVERENLVFLEMMPAKEPYITETFVWVVKIKIIMKAFALCAF